MQMDQNSTISHHVVFKTEGAQIACYAFLGKSSSTEHSEDVVNLKHCQLWINQEASRVIHIVRCLSKFEKIRNL